MRLSGNNSADWEKTIGLIMKDVSDSSLKIIDFFEGEEYERKQVKVFVDDKEITAVTYIWKARPNLLDDYDWDLKYFEDNSKNNNSF